MRGAGGADTRASLVSRNHAEPSSLPELEAHSAQAAIPESHADQIAAVRIALRRRAPDRVLDLLAVVRLRGRDKGITRSGRRWRRPSGVRGGRGEALEDQLAIVST